MRVMLPSQDHKRHKDGDVGANTGGMGAYCPCPLVSESELAVVRDRVLQKAVDGLKMEGIPFTGETRHCSHCYVLCCDSVSSGQ
jgi:phosphoribosylamine--glycine ligase/phosphoribosylglycinamide formyltransferase/phosphoribosylformylglycinamidine cyclo-ligase